MILFIYKQALYDKIINFYFFKLYNFMYNKMFFIGIIYFLQLLKK